MALLVLKKNGGVLMADNLLLTEDLTWIYRLESNPYVVRGDRSTTKVVGFFDPRVSSLKQKFSTS